MLLGAIQSASPAGLIPRVAGLSRVASAVGDFPIVADTLLPLLPVSLAQKAPPEVSARAVLVRDRGSGATLLEKNSGARLPMASLTKLMTALVVEENTRADQIVEIVESDENGIPEPRAGFQIGEKLTVGALLEAMLVSSDNDAAVALGRSTFGDPVAFVEAMNAKARALGMNSTRFANPVGFDDEQHYSTAEDLSLLVEEFLNHAGLAEIVGKKSEIISSADGKSRHLLATTNKLLLKYQEVIGLKTGYTSEAKGSLIILVNRSFSRPVQYYSIILGSDHREAETDLILDWVKSNFVWK